MIKTRLESDSVGELSVPSEAYYGIQSLRAKNNFDITGNAMSPTFIKNITLIKKAAAIVNGEYGLLEKERADAIVFACDEVLGGKYSDSFIVDAVQGGAGTSANMNVNEVIANIAIEHLGGEKGNYSIVHPNDHVNMEQSTNDVIPTAGKLTVLTLSRELIAELHALATALGKKSVEFNDVLKMGRTQLQDAVPMRMGQAFHAFSAAVKRDIKRISSTLDEMHVINMGATAIGTAINAKPQYFDHITGKLSELFGEKLERAGDLFDGTQNVDGFASVSGALKACAINLSKMCNDLRLMSSGPRTGLGEIILPAKQNGSSIMPGKVNPVIPEVVNQTAFLVIGHDVTITMAAEAGQLELNAFEPVIFYQLFESIRALTGAIDTLIKNCVDGIVVNRERCEEWVNRSVGIVTALNPYIGYKKAAEIAKESLKTGEPIKSLVIRKKLMDEAKLDEVLNPFLLTEPETERK
ncbi:MAG: aspartate ammonia-lyase [Candidatus Borkfalkiaceae bacterium]|nr:aspartate ammonia-lyase [bacterium]MDY2851193.1 aspartate ammonia-lyase [Christensenellaceae bacterium]